VFVLQAFPACVPSSVEDYAKRLKTSTVTFSKYHQALYLGGGGLKPFSDPRLVNFW
jgi:hypothetical protein